MLTVICKLPMWGTLSYSSNVIHYIPDLTYIPVYIRQILLYVVNTIFCFEGDLYVYSKLVEMYKLMEKGCKSCCVEVKCKKKRRIMTKLRGGTYIAF